MGLVSKIISPQREIGECPGKGDESETIVIESFLLIIRKWHANCFMFVKLLIHSANNIIKSIRSN